LTPASHEPEVLTALPFSNSVLSSPRYQTLPSWSCANQSYVSSTTSPSPLVTVSRTTVAEMPMISLRSGVTVTLTFSVSPSSTPS
jgi:hypothetical protein